MKLLPIGVLSCCLIVVLGQRNSLFPENKKLSYFWESGIWSGIILPSTLISSWALNATVEVQQVDANRTQFKISGIKSDHEFLDVTSLELPFYGTYVSGNLEALEVTQGDELWSVNMKRALLSLFQVRLSALNTPVLIEKEVGLYGKCNVEYSFSKINSETVKIRKSIDFDSCENYPFVNQANCPLMGCPSSYQKMVVSHSERDYLVTPQQDVFIQNISSIGRILVQPYESSAEAHYAKMSQSITIQSVTNRVESTLPELKSVNLEYEIPELDPTNGKEPHNRTELVLEIYNLLGELGDSLSSWEVGVKGLDNQTSFYILDLMWWLQMEDWEQLYNSVSVGTSYRQETIQHLFWDLVPHVGSEPAVLFIIDLVKTSRIKGFSAGRLLVSFPFYLKVDSEEFLTKCEDLLRLHNSIADDVRNSAILTFASIINKICQTNCKQDTFDRYAKYYLDKFTSSTTYEQKMLYLQGLNNIELGHVLDFLTPVITGKESSDNNIRFIAVWTTLQSINTNPSKVYDVYWPVFSNKSETLELRAAALTLLLMSNPSTSRFLSIYWFMQGETCEQLYNFYYTSIQSLAVTNFPCYAKIAREAKKISRFVPAKSRIWATGNYILDYEDPERANGGLLQTLLIASEQTGLPNVFIFLVEQHSLGHSRSYLLHLKVGGLASELCNEFDKISKSNYGGDKISKVLQILNNMNVPLKKAEDLHLEVILKVDRRTVFSRHLNKTTFTSWTETTKKLSSLYFEFSINYQNLNFPTIITKTIASDMGTPALMQIRSASLMSARGSVSQENEGRARNAEIDLRYSWNGVTGLKMYNPLSNKWHGAERCRNLHIRLPFATQLIIEIAKSVFKATAVRHRDFVTGTRLGLVWHASSRLVTRKPTIKMYPNISDEWTLDSEDLGARLGASVFDCPHPDTIPDALNLLKKAFLTNHKNYNMVPGGVVLLGLLSLKHQLHFQPHGNNCGVMLYFTPLLTQVEPVLESKGNMLKLSITRKDGILWEIQAGSKRLNDGNKEFTFKLYRTPSVSVTVGHIWRVIQLEGAFIVPSRMSGVFHPPAALTGYAFVSWGDAALSHSDKASMLDLKIVPGHNDTGGAFCEGYHPRCLQASSDLAARQTATLQYTNLPTWLKMAAHALFPEHVQTEGTHTQVTFDYPVALLPWNTKGLCALNDETVLTLDNVTMSMSLHSCYSLAIADCSKNTSFAIEIKKSEKFIGVRVHSGINTVELLQNMNETIVINVNDNEVEYTKPDYQLVHDKKTEISIRRRPQGILEVELHTGVVLQHYNTTVVILVPAVFRGYTCGLCGNFNGDTYNEPSILYTNCDVDGNI
ncbi:uncharacterized protein LOC106661112 isoform X2 [Cimex lectularius]|uniref:Vitellogenin n=1 Tax=Cimex lectularius TaxID=79782 RepID=A0A8I6TB60_CIMLE|nr:uncharacterized protein LOC106661112 isoform X2 [Cimex lectularius]